MFQRLVKKQLKTALENATKPKHELKCGKMLSICFFFQNLVKISQKHREYATIILLCFSFIQDFIGKEEGCFYA
jgi:hypothetical protein